MVIQVTIRMVWFLTALQQNNKEEGGERSGKEGGGQIIRWLYIYKVHLLSCWLNTRLDVRSISSWQSWSLLSWKNWILLHFRTPPPPYLFAAFSPCDGSSTWYQPWSDILHNVTTSTTSSATATTTTTIATATTTSTTTTTAWSNILLNNLPHLDNSQADYHPPPQVCPHPPPPLAWFSCDTGTAEHDCESSHFKVCFNWTAERGADSFNGFDQR